MSELAVPKIDCVESRENFGRFVAEPLEEGFGVTLGNALRRMLLGYLPGAAVTWIKIEGVQHEFSVIPHVKEDTLEFLLNVKSLRLKSLSSQPGKLRLEVQGPGEVSAADIEPSVDFEVINPEVHLASLDSPEARLYVEFNVELGEGYRPVEQSNNLPIGAIPVDAIFAPIRKVNFTTEPTHVGRQTSQERLHLDVWTDGTIAPEEAVSRAAKILIEQLTPFASYAQMPQVKAEKDVGLPAVPDDRYNISVDQLDLSVRTMNCLRRGGITTVGQLVNMREKDLMSLRNFGQKSMQELDERLKLLELSLRKDEPEESEESKAEDE